MDSLATVYYSDELASFLFESLKRNVVFAIVDPSIAMLFSIMDGSINLSAFSLSMTYLYLLLFSVILDRSTVL